MRSTLSALLALSLSVALAACPDDEPAPISDTADVSGDVADATDTADGADTSDAETDAGPPEYEAPAWFPDSAVAADEVVVLDGLSSPVRVVYDTRGIPHIYGANDVDLAKVQGYVTARDRLFQMHTLRSAPSGRLAEFAGPGSVRGDVLLRMLGLRRVAEEMATDLQASDPELFAMMQAFTDGVNVHLTAVNEGHAKPPLEVSIFGMQLEPWTIVDTMAIVRLQTWDLSFGGYQDELEALEAVLDLRDRFAGTPLEGIEADALNFASAVKVSTIDPDSSPGPATFDLAAVLANPFYSKLSPAMLRAHREQQAFMETMPHRKFRGRESGWGSNNWLVSGDHTASGDAIVANDTHLALRNPAVFYQVHLNSEEAGGDLQLAGVQFAGAPGITLGTNGFGAWGGTVFFSDVTDMYVERFNADQTAVLFDGGEVPIVERQETFRWLRTGGGTCDSVATGWIAAMDPQTEADGDDFCLLTVTVREVPHHGPIIPWSYATDKDGEPIAMTWKWTGFEPTEDFTAVTQLARARSVEDFKDALDHFGVGAQNWIWGDRDGHIAWYPSHLLPKRANIEAGDYSHPPFLPMPGDGSAEWDGFLDRRTEIPNATDPAKGYLVTANADPMGVSFDNDPFNDGPYIGYVWAPGFRLGRITERIEAEIAGGGGMTRETMLAIQSDHRSNVGERVTPYLLAALGDAGTLSDALTKAQTLLAEWDFEAASGVGAAAGTQAVKSAAATSLFNVFMVHVMQRAFGDEDIKLGDAMKTRLLLRMLESPETMATFDAVSGESRLWDDVTTDGVTETRADVLLASLEDAVAWLESEGGFGSADTGEWLWGELHTTVLEHNVAPNYDIPPPNEWPNGFPRPCDQYCVDASHPGYGDLDFEFGSGPAIRNTYVMSDPVEFFGVIPGGQREDPRGPHYRDEMDLWVANESPAIATTVDAVVASKESVLDVVPPSALK